MLELSGLLAIDDTAPPGPCAVSSSNATLGSWAPEYVRQQSGHCPSLCLSGFSDTRLASRLSNVWQHLFSRKATTFAWVGVESVKKGCIDSHVFWWIKCWVDQISIRRDCWMILGSLPKNMPWFIALKLCFKALAMLIACPVTCWRHWSMALKL